MRVLQEYLAVVDSKVQEHSRAAKVLYSLALVFFVGMCWSNLAAALVLGSAAASLVILSRRLGIDLQQGGRQLPLSLALGAAFLGYSLRWGFLAEQSLLFIGCWGCFYSFAMLALRYRISSFSLRLPLLVSLVGTKALLVVAPVIVSPDLLQALALEISRLPLGVGSFLGLLGDYVSSRSYGCLLLLIFPGLSAEQNYWWQRSEVLEPASMVKATKVVLNGKLQLPSRPFVTVPPLDDNMRLNVENMGAEMAGVPNVLTPAQYGIFEGAVKKNWLMLVAPGILEASDLQKLALAKHLGSHSDLVPLVKQLETVHTPEERGVLKLLRSSAGQTPSLKLRTIVDLHNKSGVTNITDSSIYVRGMFKAFPYMTKEWERMGIGLLDVKQKLLEHLVRNPVELLAREHPLALTTSFSDLTPLEHLTGDNPLKAAQVIYNQQLAVQIALAPREPLVTEVSRHFDYQCVLRSTSGGVERVGCEVKTVATFAQLFTNSNKQKEGVDSVNLEQLIKDFALKYKSGAEKERLNELWFIFYVQHPCETFGMPAERFRELFKQQIPDYLSKLEGKVRVLFPRL